MGKAMRFISLCFDIENDTLLNDVCIIAEFKKLKVK